MRGGHMKQLLRDGKVGDQDTLLAAHSEALDSSQMQQIPIENKTAEILLDRIRHSGGVGLDQRASGCEREILVPLPGGDGASRKFIRCNHGRGNLGEAVGKRLL